jgi:phospholipase/lecithinase/hemolysin
VQNFTGTAEGGPNWVEYLTGCAVEDGEHLPSDCAVQLWDFAFAGSDVAEEFLPLHHNTTTPLVNQTAQYLTWAEPVLGRRIGDKRKRALVAVWIGINDINDSQSSKPANVTFQDFWQAEVDAIFEQSVGPLYGAGYRNFLFVNLPPLDRTAANQAKTAPSPSKAQIDLWDGLLANRTLEFADEHSDAKAMVYDANTFLNGVLDNPSQYDITNLTYCPDYAQLDVLTEPEKYGCLPLDEYFWYNSGHM